MNGLALFGSGLAPALVLCLGLAMTTAGGENIVAPAKPPGQWK